MPDAFDPATAGLPLRTGDPDAYGRYRLLRRLGEGGMGTVYLAVADGERPVALKVIRTDLAGDATYLDRFRREVEQAKRVPAVCTARVLDFDVDTDPPYLVTEYIEGPTLSEEVRAHGPLDEGQATGLALAMANALDGIHGVGLVHRDLKPANVIMARNMARVIDFGIAAGATTTTTAGGNVLGTLPYIAPEVWQGRPASAASDVFAWAVVVVYAVTAHLPFGPDGGVHVGAAILAGEPDLSGVPGSLRGVVERALAKDPAARPTAVELRRELLRADAPAVAAPPVAVMAGLPSGGPDPVRARRWRIAVLAAVVVLLAAGGIAGGVDAAGRRHPAGAAGVASSPPVTVGPVASPSRGPSPSAGAPVPDDLPVPVVSDPLTAASHSLWQNDPGSGAGFNATCGYHADGYRVALSVIDRTRTWRCAAHGLVPYGDVEVAVTVRLDSIGSCAAVWLRFQPSKEGYALRICGDRVDFGTHVASTLTVLASAAVTTPIGVASRFAVFAEGDVFTLARCATAAAGCPDPQVLTTVTNATYVSPGLVELGIFEPGDADPSAAYSVTFADLDIRTPADGSPPPCDSSSGATADRNVTGDGDRYGSGVSGEPGTSSISDTAAVRPC